MMSPFKKKVLIISTALVVAAFVVPWPVGHVAHSQDACELVPVGKIVRQTLETHKELITLFAILEREYGNMIGLVPQLDILVEQCDIRQCLHDAGKCSSSSCSTTECNTGQMCEHPGQDTDICPDDVREEIEELFEKIQAAYDQIQSVEQEGAKTVFRLQLLKTALNISKGRLARFSRDEQETHVLYDCIEAKRRGLTDRCVAQDIPSFGILHGFTVQTLLEIFSQADSGLDYYICEL